MRVGLRARRGATEGRAGGQQKVSFSGSKWVYCFFTWSWSEGDGRGAGGRGECFYDLWEIFPGHCGRCPNPHVDRSHGPDKSGSLFLLRTVIPTIASQDQTWRVFR